MGRTAEAPFEQLEGFLASLPRQGQVRAGLRAWGLGLKGLRKGLGFERVLEGLGFKGFLGFRRFMAEG